MLHFLMCAGGKDAHEVGVSASTRVRVEAIHNPTFTA
jgi:hypothetical protein